MKKLKSSTRIIQLIGGLMLFMMLGGQVAGARTSWPCHTRSTGNIQILCRQLEWTNLETVSRISFRPCYYSSNANKNWNGYMPFRNNSILDGSFSGIQLNRTRLHYPLSFQNDPVLSLDARPALNYNIFPLIHYTDSSVDDEEENADSANDQTASKLLKILKSISQDKYTPFKNRDMQPIHPTPPEIQYHVLRVACLVFLWCQFNSLIDY